MIVPDLRQALRPLRREPAFAAGVIAVLALAIGANTAIFTLVNASLLRPLPLREPDRLVTFTIVRPGTDRHPLSLPDVEDFRQSSRTLDGLASFFGWSANLTGSGEAERVSAMRVSADFFEVTGAEVALGRRIQPDDERQAVALLGHGLWQRRFGGAADAVGASMLVNGEAFTIVGVLRPDFIPFLREADLVVPFSPSTDVRRANRAQAFLRVVARLKPGATVAQAADDLAAVGRRLRDEYPDSHGSDTSIRVVALHEDVSGRSAPMLWTLLVAVGLVLLVACANVANLFLVRGVARRRELALRAALGASRFRIVVHLLMEATALGMVAGALGLLAAGGLVQAVLAIGPADLPRAAEVRVDMRAGLFTLLASLGASLLVGIAPALQAGRRDLRATLQEGDRGSTVAGGRIRSLLVFAEVALSTSLLLTAGLLARSLQHVQAVDPGFRPSQTLTVRLSLPRARYSGGAAIDTFYNQLQPRIAALPGVRAVAAANVVPMNGYLATTAFFVDGVMVKDAPEAHYRMVSPDYFRAMGIPVRNGRAFTAADRHDSAPVAIINETLARHYFAGGAIGRRMRLDDGQTVPREVEVVGVVGDVRHFGLEKEAVIEVYVPIPQVPDPTTIWLANNMYWVVQTDGAPLAAANLVRREIAAVDPDVPASYVRSMDQWMGATLAPRRFYLQLVAAFAAAALLLAAVGVYAVSAAAVASRTREIGIRAALGASRRHAVGLVLRSSVAPLLAGLVAGAVIGIGSGEAVSGALFGVTPGDPVSLAVGLATLTSAVLLAHVVPALRAVRVDPVVALRHD
ncbi:MAG TPA: ABC transporter permease [Vicinamibacterales bacterium]|nr:ABC transporter permease [Vicinamibacterales bacterium]